MITYFKEVINIVHETILSPLDLIYKNIAIHNCKTNLKIECEESFGEAYHRLTRGDKEKGMVYTPKEIAGYIIKNTITAKDIINNPFIKICDPACGCGNLIIPCFNYLKEIFEVNLLEINKSKNIKIKESEIMSHIINNNLYGFDIDEFAIKILVIDLFIESRGILTNNLFQSDFLKDNLEFKMDVFIGNPPYVGHKSIEKQYANFLKQNYKNIYRDKGDLSYCFFQAALMRLNKGGKLSFITSRYFIEAPSGVELRKILKDNCSIYKIVDFYGIRPFKNIGIDPVILFILNEEDSLSDIEVIKPKFTQGEFRKEFINDLILDKEESIKRFYINKDALSDTGWMLIDNKERKIISKIENKCLTTLNDICASYQGIITGCDKAFVVNSETISNENLELDIIMPWIKSSFITKNKVRRENSYIIYSDLIVSENSHVNCLSHIEKYKDKLITRRECINGVRLWYSLQWGRIQSIFEGEKIIFPYKATGNKFAYDIGSYYSADVYSLVLKEASPYTYEFLLFILNSKLYEFYFKCFGKKLGDKLYEYYPNNLLKLCIPAMHETGLYKEEELYDFFEFSEAERRIIKG
jgi:adenine-specific DNA-methyltransferase